MYWAGTDNTDANVENIIFTINNTKSNVPVVTLLAKDNQKLSKLLSKGLERLVYWNEYKTKSDNRYKTYEFKCFPESNFVAVNRLFILAYTNEDAASKIFKTKIYYLPKGIIKNYNAIINGKNLYDQAID